MSTNDQNETEPQEIFGIPSTQWRSGASQPPNFSNVRKYILGADSDEKPDRPVMVVGISGCTSSGKSLLASLLSKIFDGSVIMHQDNYFHPKALCPITTYTPDYQDLKYVHNSMTNNDNSEYYVTSNGVTAADYEVIGLDTDCDEAVDFLSLLGMVTGVIDTGVLPDIIEFPGSPGLILGDNAAPTPAAIRSEHDMTAYKGLIEDLRQMVAKKVGHHVAANSDNGHTGKFVQPATVDGNVVYDKTPKNVNYMLPIICFIEGFLLFTDPQGPTHDEQKLEIFRNLPTTYHLKAEQMNMRSLYQTIADLTRKLETGEADEIDVSDARESIEATVWGTCIQAKYLLQSKFDVKLFLSTTKNTAMERRLNRPGYVNYPKGRRVPGQMWKTYGYFEKVAWKNHMDEHSWLINDQAEVLNEECRFDEKKEVKGVNVLPKMDAGIEETLRWAVDAILHRMFEQDLADICANPPTCRCCMPGLGHPPAG